MSFEQFVFYIFAAIMLFAAFRVITVKNPVHAAMFLVLTFFTSAAIWMLLEAEFLAITLVLVYVGAVMVLFLFVVMMLDMNVAPASEGFVQYLPVGLFVGVVMAVEMLFLITQRYFKAENYPAPASAAADFSNTESLGRALYTDYLFQFEVAAVILLVAIVAAIALTMRRRPDTKYQRPAEQIKVTKAQRLRVVSSMSAEGSCLQPMAVSAGSEHGMDNSQTTGPETTGPGNDPGNDPGNAPGKSTP